MNLKEILRGLPPCGPDGFEGLVATLLEKLTGFHFNLARSGSQAGRDMSSRVSHGNVVAIECKRYGQSTELDERQLLGEIIQATRSIPDLDLWVLVASREVPSQLFESLNWQAAETGIGFFALSSDDGDPSSLEVLCGSFPATTMNHAAVQMLEGQEGIQTLLKELSFKTDHTEKLSALRGYFVSPLAGYDPWRRRQNRSFLQSLTSTPEARANYGQPLNVEEPGVMLISRTAVWTGISKWYEQWPKNQSFLALLGEEGDGKTWAVTSWLSQQVKINDDFPAIVFLSSTDISDGGSTAPDLHALFSDQISRHLKVTTEQAKRRLDRWLTRAVEDEPLFVLVLDGLNERSSPDRWRRMLERLAGNPWINQVAVAMTCRTSYWERYPGKLRFLSVVALITAGYDDDELDAALRHHNLTRESIDEELLPLIRKPRYFDLMVTHREQISVSGDVTVGRLLFEDWRDRLERKRTVNLSVDDFQNLIRNLAEQYQAANFKLDAKEIAGSLPPSADLTAILEELKSGGVVQAVGGKYTVNKNALAQGLGLLLVEQLKEAVNGDEDPREIIARWMEPHVEMDIKAQIIEFAVLYALSSEVATQRQRVALLEAWVGSRNAEPNAQDRLVAYLPLDPGAYVGLAEAVWSDEYDNRWAQESLINAFIGKYHYPAVSAVLCSAFERWLGFVHVAGSPVYRRTEEDAERIRNEIAARLGGKAELGPNSVGNYQLTLIDDDGLLRLSKVALAVVSHLEKDPFVRAVTLGCLSDVVMGQPLKYERCAWVVRISQSNLWHALKAEVDQLLMIDTPVSRKAASRLLSFEGSAQSFALAKSIPQDLVRSELADRHQQDPCTSGFQWSREECIRCLQRERINPIWASQQIKYFVVDPTFPVPQSTVQWLAQFLNELDKNQMLVVLGTTSEDHSFETVEPTLAANAPDVLADFIRSLADQITTRDGMARRQLSVELGKHYLILQAEQQEKVRSAWENLIATADGWTKEDKETEEFLFKVLLPQLSAEEQLLTLLRRPPESLDLVAYENNFFPLTRFDQVREYLTPIIDNESLHRLLWFLTANPLTIPIDLLNESIVPLASHDDSIVRSKALELAYEIKDPTAISTIVNGRWTWDASLETFENHWGSLVLCEHGSNLRFAELYRRIDPNYLGYAITCRGRDAYEVQQYAELLNQVWMRLIRNNAELPVDLPEFTVESNNDDRIRHVSRWSLSESSSRTITFGSDYSGWGGIAPDNMVDFAEWNSEAALRHRQNLVQIVHETITQQKKAGNVWFARDFRGTGLEEVVVSHPELVAQWVTSANPSTSEGREYIRRGGAFYDALCAALLQKQTDTGVRLYWQLDETPGRITVVDSQTELELLDFALFDAPQSDALMATWQRKLEESKSDQALMKVALLAQHGLGTEWLWTYIATRVGSTVPMDRARSRVLLGFVDNEQSKAMLADLVKSDPDTWMLELTERAKDQQNKRDWSKHWFNRFLTASDEPTAWASFRLLLKCVDSSFWFWHESIGEQAIGLESTSRRLTFVEDNFESIQYAIAHNEKQIAEHLFGQKILKRQVWPWM